MRISLRLLAWLALPLAGCIAPTVSHGQEVSQRPKEFDLSYVEFDQAPENGWRKIAGEGRLLEAARLIDQYEGEKKGLEEWQRINLRFHAGQLYAFAGKHEQALARFERASRDEQPNSPIRWNAYVGATIAFLKRDRKGLHSFRDEIARGPKLDGRVPNLDVVDRLIEHFDEPYAFAYGGKPKSQQ
jgi:hypothetical protein